MSYLTRLTLRLAAGALQLPDEVRRRHAAWLAALQRDDGAFPNRSGRADLYYTGFALRGLALAGFLEDQTARRAGEFLQAHLSQALPPVDFLSLVSSAVLLEAVAGIDVFGQAGVERGLRVVESTEPFRRGDGGYAKSEAGQHSSTYQTFLVAACRELVGVAVDDPVRLATLAKQRQRADGGFVELDVLSHSGTNPTAAAVGLLRLLGGLDGAASRRAAEFLAAMQNPEGGLRANTRIPVADLLSTFAGLVALVDLDALATIDGPAVRRYVESLAEAGGGFRGGVWDSRADAEYTFYGLGALAILEAGEG